MTQSKYPLLYAFCMALSLALICGEFSGGAAAQADFQVAEASIAELQQAMDDGSLSSEELVQKYLERIEAYDKQGPALNSIVRINPDALAQARALDEEREQQGPRSALHGIPILVKDNYSTSFMPTSNGSVALADFIPAANATQIDKLLAAGAVVIAKTNLHEYAYGITTVSSLLGQTRNPYDIRRVPGGSSGGTGAAVAASFGAIGLGSDTCGSIRIPSAFNNLIGLRPSKGLSSIHGVIPLSHTQDVAAPLARGAEDLAILLDILSGYDPEDAATELVRSGPLPRFQASLRNASLAGLRFGRLQSYMDAADGASSSAIDEALAWYEEQGVELLTVEIPDAAELISASGLIGFEFQTDLDDYLATFGSALKLESIVGNGLHHRAVEGALRRSHERELDAEAYAQAYAAREDLRLAIEAAFEAQDLDAIVYPTIARTPVMIGEPQPGNNCSLAANSGLPALSMPVGFTGAGLPVGMELLGQSLTDAQLLSIAYAYEQAKQPRQAPSVVPPLESGRAPAPAQTSVLFNRQGVQLRADVVYDVTRNLILYDVEVAPASRGRVYAVTLMIDREDDFQLGDPIVFNLLGPDQERSNGERFMDSALRQAYDEDRLYLRVFAEGLPANGASQRLR